MSEDESRLARWSRLKREQRSLAREAALAPDPSMPGPAAELPEASAELPPDLPDVATLDGASDIRAFLQKNVPAGLRDAALRRAWAADPAIRDFVGLADYDWDWNVEGGVPGFGPLRLTDDVAQLLRQAMGEPEPPSPAPEPSPPALEPEAEPAAIAGDAPPTETLPEPVEQPPLLADLNLNASTDTGWERPKTSRRHGGATPRHGERGD